MGSELVRTGLRRRYNLAIMGLSERLKSLRQWMTRAVTHPGHELTRWQRALRFGYDLFRFGGRQLRQDRAPQMAAALAFHTLFGLLPVIVVSAVVAKAVLGTEQFMGQARHTLEALGLYQIEIANSTEGAVSVGEWVEGLFSDALGLNLAALGWVGLVVLLYTAVSLMVTIENSFNTIFRAAEGRSWARRVPLYWFILTISPIVIGLTLYVDSQFDSAVEAFPLWGWVLTAINVLWAFAMTWILMFCVYSFVPNAVVKYRATIVGAGVAAVLLEGGRRGLDAYFSNAIAFSKIYGSLGLIPLFMMWVFLMWLAVLFGLEVASILQHLRGRRLKELEDRVRTSSLVDPASIVTVMKVLAERFSEGDSTSLQTIATRTGMAEVLVNDLLDRLAVAGYVHRLDSEGWVLAKPAEQIGAHDLLTIGFEMVDHGSPPEDDSLLGRLRTAQLRVAGETTLEGLAAPRGESPGGA